MDGKSKQKLLKLSPKCFEKQLLQLLLCSAFKHILQTLKSQRVKANVDC